MLELLLNIQSVIPLTPSIAEEKQKRQRESSSDVQLRNFIADHLRPSLLVIHPVAAAALSLSLYPQPYVLSATKSNGTLLPLHPTAKVVCVHICLKSSNVEFGSNSSTL